MCIVCGKSVCTASMQNMWPTREQDGCQSAQTRAAAYTSIEKNKKTNISVVHKSEDTEALYLYAAAYLQLLCNINVADVLVSKYRVLEAGKRTFVSFDPVKVDNYRHR